ncbi:MAG TPA: hypothetical protein VLF87_00110, partial [Patescibacteria group bacterium]|nr:hypothetical protein [Patescibacteria group bacterium]
MKTRRTWLFFVGVSIGVAGILLTADLLHQGQNNWIDIVFFDSVNNLLLGELIAVAAVIVFLFVTKERRWLLGAWLISGIATLLILNIILNNYYWYPQNYAGA